MLILNLYLFAFVFILLIIAMEVVGGKWRTVVSTLHHIPFNLGHMSLALISYLIRNWREFQLAITLPALFFFTYWW